MDPCAIYVVNFQSIGVVFQIKKRKKERKILGIERV